MKCQDSHTREDTLLQPHSTSTHNPLHILDFATWTLVLFPSLMVTLSLRSPTLPNLFVIVMNDPVMLLIILRFRDAIGLFAG